MNTGRNTTRGLSRFSRSENGTVPFQRRRGVALLVVLLLVSITLGLSYAAMRSQATAQKIDRNFGRRGSAHQVALTGLTLALKRMHQSTWAGVNSTFSGTLDSGESYQVTFTAGVPAGHARRAEYLASGDFPYLVTLLSTGSVADPDSPASVATHRIRCVVHLVPRGIAQQPTDWATMQQYTLFQSHTYDTSLDIPYRIEGPVRFQGRLVLADHYPNDNAAWWEYLDDLNHMRVAGLPDYRPFNGPVRLPDIQQDITQFTALRVSLAVSTINTPASPAGADWTQPGSIAQYRVYTGGPLYNATQIGATVQNATLGPDPETNPLGVYYRDGTVTLDGNVTVRGSLFSRDDIEIGGPNVRFESVALPALSGTDSAVRLPVVCCRNFLVKSTAGAGGALTGLVAVFDRFEVEKGPETVEFAVVGRVITRKLYIKERQPWGTVNWKVEDEAFQAQPFPPAVRYFPVWMQQRGRNPQPRLTIKPESVAVPYTYDWHNWYDPVYVRHASDAGLRWEVVEWTENP